jgi:hypothetical protein
MTNNCPPTDVLERLLAEQLGDPEGEAVARHVEGCAGCRQALARLTEDAGHDAWPPGPRSQSPPAFLDELARFPPPEVCTPELASDTPSPAGATPPPAAPPSAPGYEVLEELGRGGMGVVYKARHHALQRLVALKVLLAGEHAAPAQLVRFRGEAEALARLRHPHIVQVYEVGEHGGLPFFALELVDGPTLAARLGGAPQTAAEAARLVEELARAVEAAHQQGVIHRDLKPANILLTADGIPKISDFGLAKRVDVVAVPTQSGEIIGTPSYMAPEQARGDRERVGPASDVYALGAILYELLTGRPPFRAVTPLDTLLQVLYEEPVPPRRLQPKVPLDLENICLKCLHKEAGKRYSHAEELADDLRRFQGGRPVRARPIGRAEKTIRWARRNPIVAGSLAALLLVLLAGSAISTYFAFDAADKAKQARNKEAEAKQNAADLEKANKGLEQSRDELEVTLARSLMRPLGLQERQPLTDPEIEAVWELATTRSERLGLRFVEEALRSPVTTRQLKSRAESALHAAVGLDLGKRAQVERLLVERLLDPQRDDAQRADVALAAVALGDLTPGAAARVARIIIPALAKATDYNARQPLSQGLVVVAARMEPKQAAATLTQDMANTSNPYALDTLAKALSVVAARIEPKDAARAAATLTQAMAKTTKPSDVSQLARGLSALAGRMEPKEAAHLCSQAAVTLTQAMDDPSMNSLVRSWSVGSLLAMVPWMEPKDGAATISQAMSKTTDAALLRQEAEALSVVAARLEHEEATSFCSQAAATLTQAMSKTTNPSALSQLAQGLSAVAARMEPEEAARLCSQAAATLTKDMSKTTNSMTLQWLAEGLLAVAAWMEPKEAAHDCSRAVAAFTQAKLPSLHFLSRWAQLVSAVAARMEPKEASRLCSQAIAKTTDPLVLGTWAQVLSAVAARMEPREAAQVCSEAAATLNAVMPKSTAFYALHELTQGLSAVATRVDPKDGAAILTQAMTQALTKGTDPRALLPLATGLSAVSARMEPKEAAHVYSQAATTLVQAASKTADARALAEVVSAVAVGMEPKEAAYVCSQAAAVVAEAMTKTTDDLTLYLLAQRLSALAARMEPKEAALVCSQAAVTLTQAPAKTAPDDDTNYLARGLCLLAAWMEPNETARLCAQAMARAKTTGPNSYLLAQDLSTALTGVYPAELSRRAAAVVATAAPCCSGPVATLARLGPALEPSPCRLSTPELIELLKQPTCVGPSRRVILDQLENRYRRKFADHWEFVHFAQQQKLGFDFTGPPKRPKR